MADVMERVTRLEERFDGMTGAMAELKIEIAELRLEMKGGFAELRADMRSESAAVRGEFAAMRAEMSTQFRWILGSIGSAALAILIAVLTAMLAQG